MSKIEKALRKAQLEKEKSNSDRVASSEGADIPSSSSSRQIAISNTKELNEIVDMHDENALTVSQMLEKKIIYPGMGDERVANSFRDLRTKLLQTFKGDNYTVAITSCIRGDDSGFTALNLATAFSLDKSKTSMFIDCNIENPFVDEKLDIDYEYGLVDYLESQELEVDKIIQPSGISRLRVIASGAASSDYSEYFTSHKMRALLEGLKERYSDRYIFINAPSIGDSADAKILSEISDYTLLVIPYAKVTKSIIDEAIKSIEPDKFLGVVFNNSPSYI